MGQPDGARAGQRRTGSERGRGCVNVSVSVGVGVGVCVYGRGQAGKESRSARAPK